MSDLSEDTKAHLHSQLVKLGDMMGDGLHHEPDGKWIEREYRQVLKALGLLPKVKRRSNVDAINEAMTRRVADVRCGSCEGQLKQTRSGSKRAKCEGCGSRWKLLK